MTAVPKPALAAGVTTTPVANGRWLLSAGDIGTITPAVHTPPGGPPYAELDLGAALPLILQFRTLGGLDALIGAAVTARAGLGEAQARHEAKQAYDDRDRDGMPEVWGELRGSDTQPDPYIDAMAAEHVTEYEPGSPLATPDGIDGLAVQDVPLPDLPHREPGEALDALADDEPATPCGRCGNPVAHPGEVRADGQPADRARFCDACIDRCHEATDFAHVCQLCATPEEAAQRGWNVSRPQPGGTIHAALRPEALAGEEPLGSLAAEPEGDPS